MSESRINSQGPASAGDITAEPVLAEAAERKAAVENDTTGALVKKLRQNRQQTNLRYQTAAPSAVASAPSAVTNASAVHQATSIYCQQCGATLNDNHCLNRNCNGYREIVPTAPKSQRQSPQAIPKKRSNHRAWAIYLILGPLVVSVFKLPVMMLHLSNLPAATSEGSGFIVGGAIGWIVGSAVSMIIGVLMLVASQGK